MAAGTVGIMFPDSYVVKKIAQTGRAGNVRVVVLHVNGGGFLHKRGDVFDVDADSCWTVDDSEMAGLLGYPDLSVDAALTAIALC